MRPNFPGKLRAIQGSAVLAMILLASVLGHAGNITENVNRTGGTGSMSGSIHTDGKTGVLGAADIVDLSIFLSHGTVNYNVNGPLSGSDSSVYYDGRDITASSPQFLFNFSGTDAGYFLVQYGVGVHSGYRYFCESNVGVICVSGGTISPGSYSSGSPAARAGNVVIGFVSSVPEPGSLALLGGGVMALAGVLRRKLLA